MAKGGRGGKGGGGGGFSRATVPMSTYRRDNNTHEILEKSGYSAEVNGYTINIQELNGGYRGNAYGVIFTKEYSTLKEAKAEVPKQFDKFLSSDRNRYDLEKTKRIYEEMKKRGGKVSKKEYDKISLQIKNELM